MEAEDTVMGWDEATKDKELTQEDIFHCEQLATIGIDPSDENAYREFETNYKEAVDAMQRYLTAQAQAEISFKAGIKEVVDSFIGAEIHSNPNSRLKAFNSILKDWQVKVITKEVEWKSRN